MMLTLSTAHAAAPDFTVGIYHEVPTIGAVLTPPAKHHFNIEAPMSAQVDSKKVTFKVAHKAKSQIIFETSEASLDQADSLSVVAFLCDDAKTYCVKKTATVSLKATQAKPVIAAPTPEKKPVETKKKVENKIQKKDEHGFWVNAQKEAMAESIRIQKPILIDFYGIWCPPCNQYNETVFPTAGFKAAAKNFVLLKMDADQETSWDLKSHFKIGGYPTLLVMKTPVNETEVKKFEEIDRIVGFFPTAELAKRMNEAYANRTERFEDRILAMKANYLEGLQRIIESKWEQKDFASAVYFADEGLKTRPDDIYFQLIKLQGQVRENEKTVADKASIALLNKIDEQKKVLSVEVLMRAQDLLVSGAEHLDKNEVQIAGRLIEELLSRVNPKTLTIDGYELSLADLYAFKVEVVSVLKDEAGAQRAREQTIDAYQKLIALQKGEAKGLHSELAYWLWNAGRSDDAKKILDRFIQKYPKEFTFYFISAKMNLELKKYAEAKLQAEKAVELSYGDNHLRSVERLVRVLTASGEPKVAVEKGNLALNQVKDPKGYFIRTDRYIVALKKAVDAAQKEIH